MVDYSRAAEGTVATNTLKSQEERKRGIYVMAHLEMSWLIWRCVGSFGDVLAYLEMLWLIWRCVGSFGDVLAHLEM